VTGSIFNWGLTANALFYLNYEPGAVSNSPRRRQWAVYRPDLKRRETHEVFNRPGEPSLVSPGFDVSEDGRWILYVTVTQEADLFLVEGFE